MRITVNVDFTAADREAIGRAAGYRGGKRASRGDCQRFAQVAVEQTLKAAKGEGQAAAQGEAAAKARLGAMARLAHG